MDENLAFNTPVFVVTMTGDFVGRRHPPGVPDVKFAKAYMILFASDGKVLEFGQLGP